MAIDLKAIAAKSKGTPEESAAAELHIQRMAAWAAEENALNSAMWHKGEFTPEEIAEFQRLRKEIDKKYQYEQ